MSGYPNPSPNGYPYNNGYTPQVPVHAGMPPTSPSHAPLPGNPGYFGNGGYGSPTRPYSAYNHPSFAPNHPVGTPSQMTPSSDTKRPLPTPRARPASVVYPPQAMSYPSPNTPIPQRSMTFDPAATVGPSYTNPVVIPQHSAFNSVGVRPASVAFPPGWNPYPSSPSGPAGSSFSTAPPSSFSGGPNRRIKKDAELPPLPPGASTPSPSAPAAPGKRSLPSAPGIVPVPGVAVGIGTPPVSAWDVQQAGAQSPPDKRPLPTPSQSLPRISTMSDIQAVSAGQATSPPSAGTSSPTKRALPTAPGAGGIKPGMNFPPPSSRPTTTTPPISNSSSQAGQTRDITPMPPSKRSGEESAPTSAPSSYASARSVFSAPSSTSSFITASGVNTRPSSYSSPSPPPTGVPRSTASDTTGGTGSGEDKRPLWKRMASGQTSSRPQSVFGYRRGGEENRAGKEASTSASVALYGALADEQGTGVRATPKQDVPQASTPVPAPVPAPVQVQVQTSKSVPTPAARHAPLPTPPAAAQARGAPSIVKPQESQQTGSNPSRGSAPETGNGSRQGHMQSQSNSSKSHVSSVQVNAVDPVTPAGPVVLPTGVQPTPIVPYQPKSKRPKAAEPSKPPEQEPVATTKHAGNSSRAAPTAPTPIPGGKVRFSREPQIQPASPPRVLPATAGPASPPRPSAMKGGGAKSPPPRVEGHSRAASAGVIQSRVPQQRQYQVPLAQPSAASPPPAAAPQVSMALRFASMDLQNEARAPDGDWAKWALVSSHDVATKPVPLTGHPATTVGSPPREKDSRRRRSASTGTIAASLEDPPPAPVINPVRRGSFDAVSGGVDTSTLIKAASASGGMRRGGARPMPSSRSSSRSRAQSRSPSEEYPQYKPSYSDSDDEDGQPGPSITISSAPQINVSAPAPEVPSIHIEGDDDVPAISITVDEPEPPVNAASVPVFAFSGPEEEQGPEPVSPTTDKAAKKKKKHRREKSVKEEEDERERARQLSKTRPLPPKIKKNSARCGKCDKPILGRIVSAMNARWHPECFKCSVCETFLEHVSSYEHDDRAYCHLDYHELFAPRCFHCQTPIMEEHFITLDDDALGKRTYHEQHFFCAECGDPFLTPKQERKTRQLENGMLEVLDQDDEVGFTVYKGHPYCEACHVRLRMPKCKRCKKSIRPGDQAIEALGGKWCWECFTCNRCSKPFDDPQFYEHEQKPFCQPCYSILLVNQLG